MSVLFDEKAIKQWFEAEESQPPVVALGDWEEIHEKILTALSAQDQYILDLEKDKRSIAIEGIRRMIGAVATTTPFGKRLIVIPHCERLSLPAAQALLKFLEEPTAGNRILLVTKFPKRLLPTIRSRVQVVSVIGKKKEKGKKKMEELIDPFQLLTSKNRRGLTDAELEAIHEMIERHLSREGRRVPLHRALLRLRDYYKIRSLGGNEKLAADILLASLLELEPQKR